MEKYALITGASGGIGRAVARNLAKEGYFLYLHYHENYESIVQLLEELQEYGGEYMPVKADLSQSVGVEELKRAIFSLDAIIHCSGSSHYGLFTDLAAEELEKLIRLHVTTPMLLTKELLPAMIGKKSGNIVLISSIWGQTGGACEVAYSAAKGAQISFVKALSKEVALNGVRVNAIAPGAVNTPMMKDFNENEIDMLKEEIPMGRLAEPIEIANGVSFLLSNKSSYITGQIIAINGGWYT
ncbi:MAG: SDR family oxidoreductase [Bacillota bacterium]|nr:SDR family oxidoreductase [Bacillota bacterium]